MYILHFTKELPILQLIFKALVGSTWGADKENLLTSYKAIQCDLRKQVQRSGKIFRPARMPS